YKRLALSVTLLGGLGFAFLLVPIPWHIDSPFLLQPRDAQQVYVKIPGFVTEVKVKPNQRVKAGDILAVLENPELRERLQETDREIRVENAHLKAMRAVADLAEVENAKQRLISLKTEREQILQQLEDLTLVSPCDGQVIPPPRRNLQPKNSPHEELAAWVGTPLENRNRQAWLPTQSLLLTIAPGDQMEAVLIVDQGDRESLRQNQRVELRLDHLPHQTFESQINDISPRNLEFAPEALSNKFGGPLATEADAQGRQRLTSMAYQATVQLSGQTPLLQTGAKGQARVMVDQRSAASWTWKWVRQTFYFRL
ncbi:MAG: HlyD family efflux transporter periplasmic adaptor subunit, partial [Planctomycetaceae bacterium]|nr:HlyD family efflux transporter periplasmic adaptor subunit [Planctomycetaceae bacterium]